MELNKRKNTFQDEKLTNSYSHFVMLIDKLNKKKLTTNVINSINSNVDEINSYTGSEKELKKLLRKSRLKVIKLLEKELKLVTKNHSRNTWMALGMSIFGLPFGVEFGASLQNMCFIGIGLL
jgi:hypothetical protein